MAKTKKSPKGKVVKNKKEFVYIDDEEGWSEIPRSKSKGSGIYALYDKYGLYYVGLTNRSLFSRLSRHTRNSHAGKWERYSWYHIPKVGPVKDIESILLNIINPPGNKIKGRFKSKTRKKTSKK